LCSIDRYCTGGPVAATPGYDASAIFKTLANAKIPFNQLLATLEDPSFPGRVSERTLVKLEGANPGLRTNPTKLKEIKLYTQMRITHIILSFYYAQDIASATSSAKGESVLVQSIWGDIGDIAAGVGAAVEAVGLVAVQAVPVVDVAVDVAVAAEVTTDVVAGGSAIVDTAGVYDAAGGSIASEESTFGAADYTA
jgi:hypothetical protein